MKKYLPLIVAPLGMAFVIFTYWIGGGEFYRHDALAFVFVGGTFVSGMFGVVTFQILNTEL